ncbi:MAG: EAL domain-containing protein [Emcibacter sp.]|nr:EAL domain-containing protein [Emcibacter sp.]MBL4894385.1 EAL domain-containing protein [Emcibacter sp.]
MTLLAHILIAATYALIGAFVAFVLPGVFSSVEGTTALIFGSVVFLVGLQFHTMYIWKIGKEDTVSRLLALHQDYQVSIDRLEESKTELDEVREKLYMLDSQQNTEIISEMHVLQTLLNQVIEKSGKSLEERVDIEGALGKEEQSAKGNLQKKLEKIERSDGEVLNIMHHALEGNRVDLYLQPIVALPSRRVIHYESYSRVRDEEDNVIFPSQYLKLAEDSGLVGTLDNLLLFRCIQVIRRLGPRRPDLRFFCNISSVSLNDKEFFPQFIDFMMENHELSDRLIFEFSQKDVLRHSALVGRSLATLGRRGFRFSMDHIVDLNMDLADLASRYFRYVKVDAKVILDQGVDIHPDDLKEAFSRYDLNLIVEKIESDQTIVEILDYGMDYGQGYLFGEPRLSSDTRLDL